MVDIVTSAAPLMRRLTLHALWCASHKSRWLKVAARHDWVFVGGCNRSGKTTLSNLFRSHPEVSVIPNANMHTKALPESTHEGCPHIWAEKLDQFRLTERDSTGPAPRLAFDWLHYHRQPRRVIMIESDLSAVQMRWLQVVFPNARMIAMVRNGYAVAEALRLKEGYAIDRCARQWRVATMTMLADLPAIQRHKVVTYEAFTGDPQGVTEDICEFIGVDPSPLAQCLQSGWRLGNADLHASLLRNDNAELLGRLTRDEALAIQNAAGELLVRFGYLPVAN